MIYIGIQTNKYTGEAQNVAVLIHKADVNKFFEKANNDNRLVRVEEWLQNTFGVPNEIYFDFEQWIKE